MNLNCNDNGALKQYHLLRGPSLTTIYYQYTCCKGGDWIQLGKTQTFVTTWQDGIGDARMIDRNALSCPSGTALQGFFLQRGGPTYGVADNLWRYNISCVSVKYGQCAQRTLPTQDFGDYSGKTYGIRYLDRQDIACNDGNVLQYSKPQTWCTYRDDAGCKLAYTIVCCSVRTGDAPLPSQYDNTIIKIQSLDTKQCLQFQKAEPLASATTGPCDNAGGAINQFYVEGYTNDNFYLTMLKVRPIPASGDVPKLSINNQLDITPELVVLKNDDEWNPGIVYNEKTNEISFPQTGRKMGTQNSVVKATDANAYLPGLSYGWNLVKQPSSSVIENFGSVCSDRTLSQLNWNQKACPFAPVVGTGNKRYEAAGQLAVPEDLSKMTLVSFANFFVRNSGTANASIAAVKFNYNEGPAVWTVRNNDVGGLPSIDCYLAENEYITKLKIIPQTSGPLPSRGVGGLVWETNLKNKCKVSSGDLQWHLHMFR